MFLKSDLVNFKKSRETYGAHNQTRPLGTGSRAIHNVSVGIARTCEEQANWRRFLGGEIRLNTHFEMPPKKYTQQDSNLQPLVPKTNALSN